MKRTLLTIVLVLIGSLFVTKFVLAEPGWQGRLSVVSVNPDGESELTRPNGKVVTTDVDSDTGIELYGRYQFGGRYGIGFGYLRGPTHEIEIPDDTDFGARDSFRFDSLNVGFAYVEPFLAYISFDDVFFESAGPPFDRDTPLNFDIDNQLGLAVVFGLDVPFDDSPWMFHAGTRVLAAGFEGKTLTDPADPDFSSSIDIDFNALVLGVGIGYRF